MRNIPQKVLHSEATKMGDAEKRDFQFEKTLLL